MAQKIVKTRLVHRKDLSTKWNSVNPILLDGEMGIEKDTRKFKIGDGVTSWNDLPYANVTYDVFNSKFSVSNDENTPGTAPVRDDSNQIHVNTTSQSDPTVAVNKGYMEKHVEAEINKISQGGKVATLDESGKIPASQLPSYVDDIIEGYAVSISTYRKYFRQEKFIHTPFTVGPLKTIYFNTKKYDDDNYFGHLENTLYDGSASNILKFSSGYILNFTVSTNTRVVRLYISGDSSKTITILDKSNFISHYDLPENIGEVVEILDESLVNNKSFQDMLSPVPFEYEYATDQNKIYIDTLTDKMYRRSSASGYDVFEISSSLALGETSSTAYAGNKGKQNANNIAALQAQVEGLQPKEESTLKTTSKTVPGAINELKQKQDTNSTNIQTNTTNITKLQQDLTAANTSIASNFNRITDLEGVADEVLIEIEEINDKIAQGGGGGGTVTVEDSFVTVNKLPEIIVQLPGTPTPTGESVYIENLYFNTSLSVEEVTNILLNYCEENNLYDQYGNANVWYVNGRTNKTQIEIKINSNDGMYIKDNAYPSFTYYWCDKQFANSNMGSYNITKVGWQDFENPLVVNENVDVLYEPIELFSITPLGEGLNPEIKLDKLYRVPIEGPTAVPNTGFVGKVYVNTSLSDEEVEAIIDKYCPINEDQADMFYNLCQRDDDEICCGVYLGAEHRYDDNDNDIVIGTGKYIVAYYEHCDDNGDWITDFSSVLWCNNIHADAEGLTPGWQEFTNPIEINTEVQDKYNYSIYNDQLTSLFSTTPYDSSGPTGYKYKQFVHGEWKELSYNGLEVKELKEKPLDPVVVPNEGLLQQVYVNTSLSYDEMLTIVESIPYNASNQNYFVLRNSSGNISITFDKTKINDNGEIGYVICFNNTKDGTNIIPIWCDEKSCAYVNNILNTNYKAGWQKFSNPIVLGNTTVTNIDNNGNPVGNYNNELTNLFSLTPYLDDMDINKIYKLPIVKSLEGILVPNQGTVNKIHFNTSLTAKEVHDIFDTLSFMQTPLLSFPLYPILFSATGTPIVIVVKAENSYEITIVKDLNTQDFEYAYVGEIGSNTGSWKLSEYEVNSSVINEYMGLPVGTLNNQLLNLISTSPFKFIKTENKYYQVVDSKPVRFGLNENEIKDLIAEYMSSNYDNGDTEEF